MDVLYLQIGNLLTVSHEIIRKVLSPLSYHDLKIAMQVCHSWSFVGNSILQKERRLRYVTIHPAHLPTTDLKVLSCGADPSPFEALSNFLEKLPMKPHYCFGFACGKWFFRNDIITRYSPNGMPLSHLLPLALPKHCQILLLNSSGVVGSVERGKMEECSGTTGNPKSSLESFNNAGYSIEVEEEPFVAGPQLAVNMEALSLLLLPKQPDTRINIFHLNDEEFYKTYRPNYRRRKSEPLEITSSEFDSVCHLTTDEDLKAFIIFNLTLSPVTKAIVNAAQARQNGNVAIGGGLVEELELSGGKGAVGIAISGSNVRATSIVIPASVKDEASMKSLLEKFKDIGAPDDHSVCFMFSCCGRGSYCYGNRRGGSSEAGCNVETRAFRALFPKTPIFGFFGNGEIGNNYPETCNCHSETPRKRKRSRAPSLFHRYSTAFVLISFL